MKLKNIIFSCVAAASITTALSGDDVKVGAEAKIAKPIATYTTIRKVGGFAIDTSRDLYFVAGHGARSPETNEYVGVKKVGDREIYDTEAQVKQIISNITASLNSQGLKLEDLNKLRIFHTQDNLQEVLAALENALGDIYREVFKDTIKVKSLPGKNVVEINGQVFPKAKERNTTPIPHELSITSQIEFVGEGVETWQKQIADIFDKNVSWMFGRVCNSKKDLVSVEVMLGKKEYFKHFNDKWNSYFAGQTEVPARTAAFDDTVFEGNSVVKLIINYIKSTD